MKTNELIAILRDERNPNVLDYIDEAADTLETQQKRIVELEAERKRNSTHLPTSPKLAALPDCEPCTKNRVCWLLRVLRLAKIALREQRRWIPVTERLPDLIPCSAGTAYSEAVIVWTSGRKAMIAVWDGIDFLCAADYWEAWGEDITHWMPLPEPPKEGI